MTIKFPSTLGECIDQLYKKREMRLAGQKEVDRVKAEEAQLENHILETFTKIDLRGAKGEEATAAIKKSTVYNIADWDTYYEWVVSTDARDCVQKRLSQLAIAERIANGEAVPGVEAFEKISLSLTRVRA